MIVALGGSLLLAVPSIAQELTPGPHDQTAEACPNDGVANGLFQGFKDGLPRPPCAEPTLLPGKVKPLNSRKPAEFATPADPTLKADTQIASTELGFQEGVAPAPGRAINYHGQKYLVIDVTANGGGPTFAGGSPFVIGIDGAKLTVGLKAILPGSTLDPDRLEVSAIN